MEIKYGLAEHEVLVEALKRKVNGLNKVGGCIKIFFTGFVAIFAIMAIVFAAFQAGSWIGAAVLVVITFGIHYGLGKLIRPVTPGMKEIFDRQYTIDRTVCEDVWHESGIDRDSVETWYYRVQGHDEDISDSKLLIREKKFITLVNGYIKKGDAVDIIITEGEKFIIKAE